MSRSVSPARWEAFHLNSAAVCRAGPAAPLLSLATPGLECVFFSNGRTKRSIYPQQIVVAPKE